MRDNRKYKVLLYSYIKSEAEISHMSQKIQQRYEELSEDLN